MSGEKNICVIIGASHAGVTAAFYLRKQGWQGAIILYDKDPNLPYHRPPLSKTYLLGDDTSLSSFHLKSQESYITDGIDLRLGVCVTKIDRDAMNIILDNGTIQNYDRLIIATGARPRIPTIQGMEHASNLFPLRSAEDAMGIKKVLLKLDRPKVLIIGGGYIGLEAAASFKKYGADVVLLEREKRILQRVASPETASFFEKLHALNGVKLLTQKDIVSLTRNGAENLVTCTDGSTYSADVIIVGIGIIVNTELAENAGLTIENGIAVNQQTQTVDPNIYAIGDCAFHYNRHYDCHIRLESVQNAVEQAKVAAANICGKATDYDSIPWFWSDQYDCKLQIVGLSTGYDQLITRKEQGETMKFSVWYFKKNRLIAVDAINNAKAYVIGTKFIKENKPVDLEKLADNTIPLKPQNLL